MRKIQVLFRSDRQSEQEKDVCKKYFETVQYRHECRDSLVIPRYSVLPYYKELEEDLKAQNCTLINSFHQHRYIANFDYYEDLAHLTPKTWFDVTEAVQNFDKCPFGIFMKGRTNSKKYLSLSLAKTKDEFYRLFDLLSKDEHISQQGIIFREYVPLEIIEESLIKKEHQFVNEWRVFFYKDKIIDYAYYWSMASDEGMEKANEQDLSLMLDLAQEVGNIVGGSGKAVFYVADLAKTLDGKWILIELNDGCQSGLSMIEPDALYNNLRLYIERDVELEFPTSSYAKWMKDIKIDPTLGREPLYELGRNKGDIGHE